MTRLRISVAPLLRFDPLRIVTNSCCDLLRDVFRNMVFRTCYVHCCALLRSMLRNVAILLRDTFRIVTYVLRTADNSWCHPVPFHDFHLLRSATSIDLIIIYAWQLFLFAIYVIYVIIYAIYYYYVIIYAIYVMTFMTYKDCTSSPVLSLPWPLGSTNVASMSYL